LGRIRTGITVPALYENTGVAGFNKENLYSAIPEAGIHASIGTTTRVQKKKKKKQSLKTFLMRKHFLGLTKKKTNKFS
jgi:hypothetical protein